MVGTAAGDAGVATIDSSRRGGIYCNLFCQGRGEGAGLEHSFERDENIGENQLDWSSRHDKNAGLRFINRCRGTNVTFAIPRVEGPDVFHTHTDVVVYLLS